MGRKTLYTVNVNDYFYPNYENSIRYDPRLFSESVGKPLTVVEEVMQSNPDLLEVPGNNNPLTLREKGVNNLLTNIYQADKCGMVVAYSRRRETYSNSNFYGLEHFKYLNIVATSDHIINLGYLHLAIGYYDTENERGRVSRIWASDKLKELFRKYETAEVSGPTIHPLFLRRELSRIEYTNPIILKNEKKLPITYSLTQKTKKMKKWLLSYNSFISPFSITIYTKDIEYRDRYMDEEYLEEQGIEWESSVSTPLLVLNSDKYLYYINLDCKLRRIFNNGSFRQGGRFYGADYQSLSKESRGKILIDGETVVEEDFSAYHIRMLYHREGIDYQGDPYKSVTGVSYLRNPTKMLMQMLINAKNFNASIEAGKKYLNSKPKDAERLYADGLDMEELARMIVRAHGPIVKYFNTGIGIKLQYTDSEIAEGIMNHFMKRKTACLCVHDSFIVQPIYRDELIEVMKREYKKSMGFEGVVG